MPLDEGPEDEREEPPTLVQAAENVVEYGRSFLFALTDHDKAHQDHFRACLEHWLDVLGQLVAKEQSKGRDRVDPAIWDIGMELFRRLPRDETPDDDDTEPFF